MKVYVNNIIKLYWRFHPGNLSETELEGEQILEMNGKTLEEDENVNDVDKKGREDSTNEHDVNGVDSNEEKGSRQKDMNKEGNNSQGTSM